MTDRELKQALRDKILRRMKELKMAHKELAIILDIRPSTLSTLLSTNNNMTVYNLHKLEQALQMNLLNLN